MLSIYKNAFFYEILTKNFCQIEYYLFFLLSESIIRIFSTNQDKINPDVFFSYIIISEIHNILILFLILRIARDF